MEKRTRPMRIARTLRVATVALAMLGAAACAAVLGIDDRALIDDGGGDGATRDGASDTATRDGASDTATRDSPAANDGGDLDGNMPTDAPADAPLGVCDPGTCAAVGGACSALGVCVVACTTTSCQNGRTFNCPAGTDCRLNCVSDTCDKLRCAGGRSCTIDCNVSGSCHNGVSCQSGRCEILCTGPTASCGGGGGADPVICEAGVCLVNCSGANSCTAGVIASAGTYCGIRCTGNESCWESGAAVTCGASPDASIFCGPGPKTCEQGKPSCFGGNCAIQCLGPDSCQSGHCCEAGTCAVNAPGRASVCP